QFFVLPRPAYLMETIWQGRSAHLAHQSQKNKRYPVKNQVSLIYFVSQFTDIQLTVGILFHRMDMDIENPVCPLQGPG
ncbi:MAG: hypothetical protein PUK85_01295, partial [Clostridia bacterium]|nr:hypothetical protein [Clostridia bacterium]